MTPAEYKLAARRPLGMGLVGPGFIAAHHIDAVRRLGNVDVIAIAGSSADSAARKATRLGVQRSYGSYEELLADPDIDVVHNTTPSYLHEQVTMAAIAAGKHIISDKPLALDPGQCRRLRDAADTAGVVNAVTFNYRGNPLVQQMRAMVAENSIGTPVFLHGQYLQDWLTDEAAYSWRLDPEKGGASSALADIGSHWCDLAEHVSSSAITAVLADLTTVVKTRYTVSSTGSTGSAGSTGSTGPAGSAGSEAFAGREQGKRQPVSIHSEDLAAVLLRFANGARGSLTVGQVLPGHKNDLQLEVNGRTGSLKWVQERQNELWIGRYDQPNTLLLKDPALLLPAARPYAHLPGGHQEGWPDAFFNVIRDIYRTIEADGVLAPQAATLCTFADATHTACVIDAMLQSHAKGGVWTEVAAG